MESVTRKIVEHLGQVDYAEMVVPMAVIYKSTKDLQEEYIVRLWEGEKGTPTNIEVRTETLNEARKAIARSRRMDFCIPRAECDDPAIVETWM